MNHLTNNKKVVAILPAYNAAKTLKETSDAIPKDWVDDVILVDDASKDNTAEVSRSLGIKTIVHEKNKGYGGNQKTCYKEALKMGADIVVMIHPDFQYDPYYIPELIRPLAFGKADVSLGSRMLVKRNAIKGGMPWWKFIGNIFLTTVENIILGLGLSEYHTGFRAYTKGALEAIPFEKNSDDFVFDSEIIVQARILNFHIFETPIETKYFPEASSINFRRSVEYGFAILGVMLKYILFRLGIFCPPQFEMRRRGETTDVSSAGGDARPSSTGVFLLVSLAIGFMLVYSFLYLTTKPKFGVDESMTVEVAHNVLGHSRFNILVAPDTFAERPYTIAATGYAVTLPLAGVFKVWGFGLVQARLYMIVWMLVFLSTVFWIVWDIFGRAAAVSALFLIVTFATFYDIGRTAMGELPGLVFFLWGVYLLSCRTRFFLSGLLLGLALTTKPSLYIAVIPVLGIYLLMRRKAHSFGEIARLVVGGALPLALWVLSVFPNLFSIISWREALAFLQNPFGRSLFANIIGNLRTLATSSTLIYFYAIAAVSVFFLYRESVAMPDARRNFITLALLESALGFLYFLRSPGWFRYLFATELLLLMLLYPALGSCIAWARRAGILPAQPPTVTVVFLTMLFIGMQTVQLFWFSRILSSDEPQVISSYINRELAQHGGAVGVINNKQVAALVPAERRYQQFQWTGTPLVGINPLALDTGHLPRLLLVAEKDHAVFVDPYKDVFATHYALKQIFFTNQYLFERVR